MLRKPNALKIKRRVKSWESINSRVRRSSKLNHPCNTSSVLHRENRTVWNKATWDFLGNKANLMLVKLHHIVYYRSFFSLLSAETRCGPYYESFNFRRELFKCGLWFWCHYNPSPLGHRSYRTPTLTWVHNPESKSRFTFRNCDQKGTCIVSRNISYLIVE